VGATRRDPHVGLKRTQRREPVARVERVDAVELQVDDRLTDAHPGEPPRPGRPCERHRSPDERKARAARHLDGHLDDRPGVGLGARTGPPPERPPDAVRLRRREQDLGPVDDRTALPPPRGDGTDRGRLGEPVGWTREDGRVVEVTLLGEDVEDGVGDGVARGPEADRPLELEDGPVRLADLRIDAPGRLVGFVLHAFAEHQRG